MSIPAVIRPLLPTMPVRLERPTPVAGALAPAVAGALAPALPGVPTNGAQVNDGPPTAAAPYSSQRTEQRIADVVAAELYDYDGLVAATLNI